jgi:hypothetical protein
MPLETLHIIIILCICIIVTVLITHIFTYTIKVRKESLIIVKTSLIDVKEFNKDDIIQLSSCYKKEVTHPRQSIIKRSNKTIKDNKRIRWRDHHQ